MSGILNIQLIHNLKSADVCGIIMWRLLTSAELFGNFVVTQQIAKGVVERIDMQELLSRPINALISVFMPESVASTTRLWTS